LVEKIFSLIRCTPNNICHKSTVITVAYRCQIISIYLSPFRVNHNQCVVQVVRRLHKRDDSQIHLSDILQAVSQIGYIAHPYDPSRQQEVLERERKQQLRRIGVAGVLGMQVMMMSLALYAGDWYGMAPEFKMLFYGVNLILTLPIIFYCAKPFFKSAWRDVSHRQVGMDVPIALALSLAFLVHLVPTMATRLSQMADGMKEELILVAELVVGDRLLIRPGENIPADGSILEGQSSVDESLLTGESHPINKSKGQTLIAGTVNIESPLQMQVDKIGADTVLSHILRLLERLYWGC